MAGNMRWRWGSSRAAVGVAVPSSVVSKSTKDGPKTTAALTVSGTLSVDLSFSISACRMASCRWRWEVGKRRCEKGPHSSPRVSAHLLCCFRRTLEHASHAFFILAACGRRPLFFEKALLDARGSVPRLRYGVEHRDDDVGLLHACGFLRGPCPPRRRRVADIQQQVSLVQLEAEARLCSAAGKGQKDLEVGRLGGWR